MGRETRSWMHKEKHAQINDFKYAIKLWSDIAIDSEFFKFLKGDNKKKMINCKH